MLSIGMTAPEVTLRDENGAAMPLSSLRTKTLVLYFYPKDDTPGCTMEACAFRDAYEEFTQAGAEVIGVSSDDPSSHGRFTAKHRLPFRLLSDPDGSARKAFGVPKTLGILPGRVTFVIDTGGVIRHVFNSQFLATKHVAQALAVVTELAAAPIAT